MFSLMDSYLADLPNGLDSYPEAMAKPGGTLELFKVWPEILALAPKLPLPLSRLVQAPPPTSVWVSEVHAEALWLVAYEVRCGGAEHAYLDLINTIVAKQLRSPAYQLLFRALGARLSVRAIAAAWSNFHRGSDLVVTRQDGRDTTVELRFPRALLHAATLGGFGQAFLVALEIGGVVSPSVRLVDATPTHARFQCSA